MYQFGENHPIIFEIILFIVAFAGASVFSIAGYIFNLHPALGSSAGRIFVGVVLFFLYKRAYKGNRFLTNPVLVLPALLFPLWNIFYYLSSGIAIGGLPFFVEAFITAIAPAIFEEVIFREIFIYNLKKKGNSDMQCLFISAILFSAVHLTNLAGMAVAAVALQVVYSFVIGLVFAAIYLKNESLLQIICVHFLIDFTTRIFVEPTTHASNLQLIVFVIVLIIEAIYAVKLTAGKTGDQ